MAGLGRRIVAPFGAAAGAGKACWNNQNIQAFQSPGDSYCRAAMFSADTATTGMPGERRRGDLCEYQPLNSHNNHKQPIGKWHPASREC